jgi:DNA-binding NarL/FixJ family response regulator
MRAGQILIIDSDEEARRGLISLLARLGHPVSAAADANRALVHVERVEPALIVLDLETGGLELCHELLDRLRGRVPVILVSAKRTEPADRVAGLLVGADDYLAKPFDPGELLARARRSLRRAGMAAATAPPSNPLTPREVEILRLLDQRSNKQIARHLAISSKTVSTHIQHILTKLRVHTRTQAVAYAVRNGIQPEPSPRFRDGLAHPPAETGGMGGEALVVDEGDHRRMHPRE